MLRLAYDAAHVLAPLGQGTPRAERPRRGIRNDGAESKEFLVTVCHSDCAHMSVRKEGKVQHAYWQPPFTYVAVKVQTITGAGKAIPKSKSRAGHKNFGGGSVVGGAVIECPMHAVRCFFCVQRDCQGRFAEPVVLSPALDVVCPFCRISCLAWHTVMMGYDDMRPPIGGYVAEVDKAVKRKDLPLTQLCCCDRYDHRMIRMRLEHSHSQRPMCYAGEICRTGVVC
jgi:hypothetical protein